MSRSASRSGAYFSRLVCSTSNSQPMWAKPEALDQRRQRLAVAPRRVRVALAVAEGVVAAVVGDPADDRALDRHAMPAMASAIRSGRLALNEPWVK